MRNRTNGLRWSLGFFMAVASVAQARPFFYLAKKTPAHPAPQCHQDARELALKFTQITGFSAQGECRSVSAEGNDLLIRYEAEDALEVLSTAPNDLDFPGRGYEFSSRRECEGQIETENQFFKEQTGVEPLLSFCRFRENYYGLKRWALVVESVGSSGLKPLWASSLFPGKPNEQQIQQIKEQVKKSLANSTLLPRFVFLQEDEHGHLRLTVMYYGKYHEQLKAFALANLERLEDCAPALSDLQKLDTLGYCIHNPYRRGADLVAIVDTTQWHQIRQSVESFKTFSECQTQREGLIEFYKTSLGYKILTGFCTEFGPAWKINFLEAR